MLQLDPEWQWCSHQALVSLLGCFWFPWLLLKSSYEAKLWPFGRLLPATLKISVLSVPWFQNGCVCKVNLLIL